MKDYFRRETWAQKNGYTSEHFQLLLTEMQCEPKSTEISGFRYDWLLELKLGHQGSVSLSFFSLVLQQPVSSSRLRSHPISSPRTSNKVVGIHRIGRTWDGILSLWLIIEDRKMEYVNWARLGSMFTSGALPTTLELRVGKKLLQRKTE